MLLQTYYHAMIQLPKFIIPLFALLELASALSTACNTEIVELLSKIRQFDHIDFTALDSALITRVPMKVLTDPSHLDSAIFLMEKISPERCITQLPLYTRPTPGLQPY